MVGLSSKVSTFRLVFFVEKFFFNSFFYWSKYELICCNFAKVFHSFLTNVSSNQITEPPVISFFNQKTLSSQCLVDFFCCFGGLTSFSIVCIKFVFLSNFLSSQDCFYQGGEHTSIFFYLSGKIYLAEQFFYGFWWEKEQQIVVYSNNRSNILSCQIVFLYIVDQGGMQESTQRNFVCVYGV